MTTNGLYAATVAKRFVSPGWTVLEHAQVTEGEVVANGIFGIERCKGSRDLLRGLPIDGAARRKPEIPGKLVDVGIDGNHQQSPRKFPQTEIDAVVRPHHPPSEKQQSLRGASVSEVWKDMARPAP